LDQLLPGVFFGQGTDIRTFALMPEPWGAVAGAAAGLAKDEMCG